MGPIPKPITNRERPRVATTLETLNSSVIWPYVIVYKLLVHVLMVISDRLDDDGEDFLTRMKNSLTQR
jgi:hypothetical protein